MKRISGTLIVFALLFQAAALAAAINPVEYARMQDTAPEQLYIRTLKVKASREGLFSRTRNVRVTAEVESVIRSETGLREGSAILIEYSNYSPGRGWVGPRPVPILLEGYTYPAFLLYDEEKEIFSPAARGYSFESQLPFD